QLAEQVRVQGMAQAAPGDVADAFADLLGGKDAAIPATPQKDGIDGLAGADLARAAAEEGTPDLDIALEECRELDRQRLIDRLPVLGLVSLEYDPPHLAALDQAAPKAELSQVPDAHWTGTEDQNHEPVPVGNRTQPVRQLRIGLCLIDRSPTEFEQHLNRNKPGSVIACWPDGILEPRALPPEPVRATVG